MTNRPRVLDPTTLPILDDYDDGLSGMYALLTADQDDTPLPAEQP